MRVHIIAIAVSGLMTCIAALTFAQSVPTVDPVKVLVDRLDRQIIKHKEKSFERRGSPD